MVSLEEPGRGVEEASGRGSEGQSALEVGQEASSEEVQGGRGLEGLGLGTQEASDEPLWKE